MRSLIKSHKRDSTGSNNEVGSGDFDFESPLVEDQLPTSPSTLSTLSTVHSPNKGRKLQRLFHRTRNPALNILTYSSGLSPVSPKEKSPAPSIIGTRTHEWGSSHQQQQKHQQQQRQQQYKQLQKQNQEQHQEEQQNQKEEEGGKEGKEGKEQPITQTDTPVDTELIKLPLNTVLEIPDKDTLESGSSSAAIKNAHRKAQIVSTDGMKLEDAAQLIPHLNRISSSSALDSDGHSSESGGSEFSFEQNNITGRNSSIRYYKSQSQQELEQPTHTVQLQGYYVNDLVDDNFDEDMNHFDEDDDFNDDEELFNRKYFADDDDEEEQADHYFGSQISTQSLSQLQSQNPTQTQPTQQTTTQQATRPLLQPTRSLKYHQLPNGLEQEFNTKRYSWFSDDETDFQKKDLNSFQDDDSYLDEINGIPENYESDSSQDRRPPLSKSKSMNSSLKKIKKVVVDNNNQSNKIITSSKTVTLFNHPTSKSTSNLNSTSNSESFQPFSYSTPNSSFTSPNPKFISEQGDLDLSPISEASFDGSP